MASPAVDGDGARDRVQSPLAGLEQVVKLFRNVLGRCRSERGQFSYLTAVPQPDYPQ